MGSKRCTPWKLSLVTSRVKNSTSFESTHVKCIPELQNKQRLTYLNKLHKGTR